MNAHITASKGDSEVQALSFRERSGLKFKEEEWRAGVIKGSVTGLVVGLRTYMANNVEVKIDPKTFTGESDKVLTVLLFFNFNKAVDFKKIKARYKVLFRKSGLESVCQLQNMQLLLQRRPKEGFDHMPMKEAAKLSNKNNTTTRSF